MARAFPQTTIVLNHVGGPLGIGPYADKKQETFAVWKAGIAELGKCQNVVAQFFGVKRLATRSLQCCDHDRPKAGLARDHNMHGNRRVVLLGELELVETALLPRRVAPPIILVISLAAWALALSLTREPRV